MHNTSVDLRGNLGGGLECVFVHWRDDYSHSPSEMNSRIDVPPTIFTPNLM